MAKFLVSLFLLEIVIPLIMGQVENSFNGNIAGDGSLNNNANAGFAGRRAQPTVPSIIVPTRAVTKSDRYTGYDFYGTFTGYFDRLGGLNPGRQSGFSLGETDGFGLGSWFFFPYDLRRSGFAGR